MGWGLSVRERAGVVSHAIRSSPPPPLGLQVLLPSTPSADQSPTPSETSYPPQPVAPNPLHQQHNTHQFGNPHPHPLNQPQAFQRADQIAHASGKSDTHWFAPIVADAEAGFGGNLNAYELMRAMIKVRVRGWGLRVWGLDGRVGGRGDEGCVSGHAFVQVFVCVFACACAL